MNLRREARETLKLAAPIVLGQVGHMTMGLVDTMVAGRIDTVTQAGLGLAANYFWTSTFIFIGVLLALDTFFAQSVGAGDEKALRIQFGQAHWLGALMTLVAGLALFAGKSIYLWVSGETAVGRVFATYVNWVGGSLPALIFFYILQRYWQARGVAMPFTLVILAANLLNWAANLAFGLGYWGFPKMGEAGIALATLLTRTAMLAWAIFFTWDRLGRPRWELPPIDWEVQRGFLRIGLPACGHTAVEMSVFVVATFLAGALGAVPLAAHHVALTLASFSFMFPLGFSSAAATRVGNCAGAGLPRQGYLAGWFSLGCAAGIMAIFGLVFVLYSEPLLRWFTQDRAVIAVGVKLMFIVALFQVADGIQVTAIGALRGIGNTRTPLMATLIGHYGTGLTLSVYLCFFAGWGVTGLWIGLAAGLIVVAGILLWAWVKTGAHTPT